MDLADAENALLGALSGALFNLPLATDAGALLLTDGGQQIIADTGNAYTPPAVETGPGGIQARLYRGWPPSSGLIEDLRAGISNVSIFPAPGMARNTTRYIGGAVFTTQPAGAPSMLLHSNGFGTVTVNGAPAAGLLCGIMVGEPGTALAYAYAVQATDTCASVAAALAALVPGASAAGAIVTVPGVNVVARCVQTGASYTEVRRQVQVIRVSVWAPTHDQRDALAAACDLAIAPYTRITIPTGETLYQRYAGTQVSDVPTRNEAWMRALLYSVEYPTNVVAAAAEMLFGVGTINGAPPFNA